MKSEFGFGLCQTKGIPKKGGYYFGSLKPTLKLDDETGTTKTHTHTHLCRKSVEPHQFTRRKSADPSCNDQEHCVRGCVDGHIQQDHPDEMHGGVNKASDVKLDSHGLAPHDW